MTSRYLRSGASVVALAASFAVLSTGAAHAQGAVEALRETITIQGTKKADGEALQAAPVAVNAFGEAQLDALYVRDLQSLSYNMPNVQLEDIGTIASTANFSIRGIGVNSSIPSIDPTVGVFVDGIYYGINSGVIFDTFDLESIEVLRGPQGVLFGRNVTGGAVLVNTAVPDDEVEVKAKFSVETGLNYTGQASVSGPLVEDRVFGKVSVLYNEDEGYFDNTTLGTDDAGASDLFIIRPVLRFTPTDTLEIIARAEYGERDGEAGVAANRGLNGDEIVSVVDEPGFQTNEWTQLFTEVNWDVPFGDGTITNIAGFRNFESSTFGDIDASPLFVFHSGAEIDQSQFSNELRYSGRFGNAGVTAGLFYFDQELNYIEDREIPSVPLPFVGGGRQDTTTVGLFAQVDYDVSEQLTLNVGARYSEEEKDVGIATLLLTNTGCSVASVSCSNPDFVDSVEFDNLSPKVGFQYRFNEDVQAYGSFTQAFRAGGYNLRNTSPTAAPGPFDDEQLDAIEFGLKGDFADGMLRFNTAVFNYDISDMQREINQADPVSGVVQIITNTADATVQGFEAELQAILTDNFLVNASIGLVDGEYDSVLFDISGDGVVNDRDLALDIPRLAPQTYSLGAVYDHSLGDMGTLTSSLNWNFRSGAAYTDNNLGRFPSADIVNASVRWSDVEGRYTLSLYGKNLLDEFSIGNDTQLPTNFPGSPTFPIPSLAGTGATFSPLNKGQIIGVEFQIRR